MASTDGKSYVNGTAGNDDITALNNNKNGFFLDAGRGNDILRGGSFNDILDGGEGNDQMFGGTGADQFRFFGNLVSDGRDTDNIRDLNFGEGDTLVFGNYEAGTFFDTAGVNGFNSGSDAIISSFEGIVNAVNGSEDVAAFSTSPFNNNLTLAIRDADGDVQEVVITDAFKMYMAAGGQTDMLA